MATHKSAIKRHRQSEKRREHNRQSRSAIRTAIKDALTCVEKGDKEAAKKALVVATKLLDKAAIHGLVHKNNAQRHVSRLSSRVAKMSAAK